MTAPNGKLDVIRKLLAKAEGAATPEEAEAYTEKAIELMARYGVDEAMVSASGERPDTIGRLTVTFDAPYTTEKAQLLGWIAYPLRCQSVSYLSGTGRTVLRMTLLGFESDLNRVEMLYTSLLLQATSQLVHQRPDDWYEDVRAYRRTWFTGFAQVISARLHEAEKKAATAHDTETGTPGTALVLIDRKEQVRQAYEEAFPKLGTAKSRSLSGSGLYAGRAAGRQANLGAHAGVGGRKGELT